MRRMKKKKPSGDGSRGRKAAPWLPDVSGGGKGRPGQGQGQGKRGPSGPQRPGGERRSAKPQFGRRDQIGAERTGDPIRGSASSSR